MLIAALNLSQTFGRLRALLGTALLCYLLLLTLPLAVSLADGPTSVTSISPLAPTEQRLFDRINQIRIDHGLHPFTLDARLAQAATAHVLEMQRYETLTHRGFDGSTPRLRIERTGYVPATANEAIGWNFSLDRMIEWWLNSPIHRRILLSPEYTQIGIGYVGDPAQKWGHWWVLNVAAHK